MYYNGTDLSILLYQAGNEKDSLTKLMYDLKVSRIINLQQRVIKQLNELADEKEKEAYADRIILANNLPICYEFYRIISNGYSKKEYLSKTDVNYGYHTHRSEQNWDLYEKFYKLSKVLRDKKNKIDSELEERRSSTVGYAGKTFKNSKWRF